MPLFPCWAPGVRIVDRTLTGETGLDYDFEPHPLRKLGTFKARRCVYLFSRKFCNPVSPEDVLYRLDGQCQERVDPRPRTVCRVSGGTEGCSCVHRGAARSNTDYTATRT